MFENPEVMRELAAIAGMIASGLVTIILGIIVAKVQQYTGIKIEEKYKNDIKDAAKTWAEDAVLRGVTPATANLGEDFLAYARKSVPDALALVKDSGVVEKIAKKYLIRAVNGVIPGKNFDIPTGR